MVDMKKVRFFTQTSISVAVLLFCMGMLINGEKTEIYLPVLTGMVGYWLPQPSAKNNTDEISVPKSETQGVQEMRQRIEGNIYNNV